MNPILRKIFAEKLGKRILPNISNCSIGSCSKPPLSFYKHLPLFSENCFTVQLFKMYLFFRYHEISSMQSMIWLPPPTQNVQKICNTCWQILIHSIHFWKRFATTTTEVILIGSHFSKWCCCIQKGFSDLNDCHFLQYNENWC